MKNRAPLLGAFSLLLLFGFTSNYLSENYTIAEDYSIRFAGRGAEGNFTGLEGSIQFDANDLAGSNFDVTVDANTISTGNSTKDKHARGDNWFDVEKYPTIRFQSTAFAKKGTQYSVTGNLTLHGTTKLITIPFDFTETTEGGVFTGNFVVNRETFGIEGNAFSFVVDDEFAVSLRIPVE